MRELRRSGHDVADGVDAWLAGPLMFVYFDEAAIKFVRGVLKADVFRVRLAPDRDQQLFGLHLFGCRWRESPSG